MAPHRSTKASLLQRLSSVLLLAFAACGGLEGSNTEGQVTDPLVDPPRSGDPADPADEPIPEDTAVELARPTENKPPACTVLSPSQGDDYSQDDFIYFDAEVVDPDDEMNQLEIIWTTNQGGAFLGNGFDARLQPGLHAVRLEVTDPAGAQCTHVVEINVLPE